MPYIWITFVINIVYIVTSESAIRFPSWKVGNKYFSQNLNQLTAEFKKLIVYNCLHARSAFKKFKFVQDRTKVGGCQ